MTDDARILPRLSPPALPYWEGCRVGELRLQHCPACGHVQFPPRSHCTRCRHGSLTWRAVSGRGTVASFTWVHLPLTEAWAEDVPYALALIRLDEGPLLMTNVRECAPERLAIGLPVEVCFEQRSEAIHLPQFRPARPTPKEAEA